MSLLKDGEILAALNKAWGNDTVESINDVECGDRAIAEAQRTQTLKAVAEWMDGKCDQMIHGSITLGQRLRRDCCYCMRDMAEFAREGKMPGEEK